MRPRAPLAVLASLAALASMDLRAQVFTAAPFGFTNADGGVANLIPFWSGSATYQQVHDASDLVNVFGGPVAVITSINFRLADTGQTASARTLRAQVAVGTTSVTADTLSPTFATNLGPSPAIVLPYTTINLPALSNVSRPNPIGWRFPFRTSSVYATAGGNLCWELRFTNASNNGLTWSDAVDQIFVRLLPNLGTGCIATGQTSRATIGEKTLYTPTGEWRNRLDRGASNAAVVQLIGFGASAIPLPGFCGQLETAPLASLSSVTDGAGTSLMVYSVGSLRDALPVDLVAQFAWLDAGLPNGVGLSDASLIRMPPESTRHVSRAWAAPFNTGLGNETATIGSGTLRFGLVTIFGI